MFTTTSSFYDTIPPCPSRRDPTPCYLPLFPSLPEPPPAALRVTSDLRGSSVGFPKQEKLRRCPGHEHAHVGPSPDEPVGVGGGVVPCTRVSLPDESVYGRLLSAWPPGISLCLNNIFPYGSFLPCSPMFSTSFGTHADAEKIPSDSAHALFKFDEQTKPSFKSFCKSTSMSIQFSASSTSLRTIKTQSSVNLFLRRVSTPPPNAGICPL